MPDEIKNESSDKEEAFFKNQEETIAAETPPEESSHGEPTPEQLKEQLGRLERERETLVEKLVRQSTARSEARRELKEAKAKLKELTEQFDDLPSKEKAEEVKEEAPKGDAIEPTKPELDRLVEEKIYEKDVIRAIRGKAQFREDAEVVKAYVDKLRKGGLSTGDAEQDVAGAIALLDKRGEVSSIPSPTSVSGGSYAPESSNRVSKGALEMGKVFGHTAEDFKKYGDGEIVIK